MVEEDITLDKVLEAIATGQILGNYLEHRRGACCLLCGVTRESRSLKCIIEGCPGEYEERKIVHTVRYQGRLIVIDHLPAEVCSVCGDVLLKPETVRRIEMLL